MNAPKIPNMHDEEKAPTSGLGPEHQDPPMPLNSTQSVIKPTIDQDQQLSAEKRKRFSRPTGYEWFLTVSAVLSCVFLFALDTTVVADIQANIISSLGEFEKFPWLAIAYALPATALVLIQSKVYALFDIKWLYFGYVACFEVGSAISAAAPTMNAMIVGRMIAGIGGCGIYVGSLTFFSVATTEKERALYISLIAPVWGLGTVLGPIIGGAFAESPLGWRWGFYINLILFAFIGPILIFLVPSIDFAAGQTLRKRLNQIDWLGLLVWTSLCVTFFMAITYGGTLFAWSSPSMIILWVFTGLLVIAFYLTHKYHPLVTLENRLYPSHLLRNIKLGILQYATFSAAAAVYIPIYYIPLYFQFAKGEAPVEAAIKLLPFVSMIAAVSILNGALMSKFGYYMPWFLVGAMLAAIGGGLMYTVTIDTRVEAIYGFSVLLGVGSGCFLVTAFGCVSDVVGPEDVFNAIGVLSLAQCIGITFFPALSSTLFQNVGTRQLAPILDMVGFQGEAKTVLAGANSVAWQSFSEETQRLLAVTIVDAIHNVYILTIVACVLTVLSAPCLEFRKLGAQKNEKTT